MASSVRATLPLSVVQIVDSPSWMGGCLVQLENTVCKPKADDLVINYCWICPFVKNFRSQIPSQFFLTDVFLYLDKMYCSRLLIPQDAGESKVGLATDEAKKVKLCIGALRGLWRSTCKWSRFGVYFVFLVMTYFRHLFDPFISIWFVQQRPEVPMVAILASQK